MFKAISISPVKSLLALALVGLSFAAQAQQGMSEEQMRLLMQGAAQMQACFANVDQAELEAMGTQAEAVQGELKALCAAGERDQAQTRAVDFAREFADSETLKQMRECGDIARAMIPQVLNYVDENVDNSEGSTHVCDNL
jgi:hypothetical protein